MPPGFLLLLPAGTNGVRSTAFLLSDQFAMPAALHCLGVALPPEATFAMRVGTLVSWLAGRRRKEPGSTGQRLWFEGCEPSGAEPISGAAPMGIGNALVNGLMD